MGYYKKYKVRSPRSRYRKVRAVKGDIIALKSYNYSSLWGKYAEVLESDRRKSQGIISIKDLRGATSYDKRNLFETRKLKVDNSLLYKKTYVVNLYNNIIK